MTFAGPGCVKKAMANFYVFLLATARFIGGSSSEPCALKEWLYESSAWAPPGYHVSLGNTKRLVKGSLVGLGKIYSIEKKNQTFFFAPFGKTFCPVWLFDLFWLGVPSFFSLEIFRRGQKMAIFGCFPTNRHFGVTKIAFRTLVFF